MASSDKNPDLIISVSSTSSLSDPWKERILVPTLLAGVAGAGVGLISKHQKVHGLSNISAAYVTNFAIITGFYCGSREFVRVSRTGKPYDFLNSIIGGFGSGAILGRLQGGDDTLLDGQTTIEMAELSLDESQLEALIFDDDE